MDRVDWHIYISELQNFQDKLKRKPTYTGTLDYNWLSEDHWEEATVPGVDHDEGREQHHQESTAEWDVHGDKRTKLQVQAKTGIMGLPDIMFNMVSKDEIKQAIKCYSRLDLKEEVQYDQLELE